MLEFLIIFDFFKLEFLKNHLEKIKTISILFVYCIKWEFSIEFGTIEKYDFLKIRYI